MLVVNGPMFQRVDCSNARLFHGSIVQRFNLTNVDTNETVERLEEERDRLGERLAFREHEAAALLSVERHTLRDARLRGEVEASRLGRRIIYSRDQLLRLLERNRA